MGLFVHLDTLRHEMIILLARDIHDALTSKVCSCSLGNIKRGSCARLLADVDDDNDNANASVSTTMHSHVLLHFLGSLYQINRQSSRSL